MTLPAARFDRHDRYDCDRGPLQPVPQAVTRHGRRAVSDAPCGLSILDWTCWQPVTSVHDNQHAVRLDSGRLFVHLTPDMEIP